MQTSGTFNIVIQMPSNTKTKKATPASPAQPKAPVQSDPVRGDKESDGSGITSAAIANLAISSAKQAGMAAISNIGLATGNSYKQTQVSKAVQLGVTAFGLGASIFTGNYLGAAAMGVSSVVDYINELYATNKTREIMNYQAGQYARRLGYTKAR